MYFFSQFFCFVTCVQMSIFCLQFAQIKKILRGNCVTSNPGQEIINPPGYHTMVKVPKSNSIHLQKRFLLFLLNVLLSCFAVCVIPSVIRVELVCKMSQRCSFFTVFMLLKWTGCFEGDSWTTWRAHAASYMQSSPLCCHQFRSGIVLTADQIHMSALRGRCI